MAYIYQITNDINGKIYIGKTERSIEERFAEHCRSCLRQEAEQRPLYRAMRKYGTEHFHIELLEKTDFPEERETYWIEQKRSYKEGYNATLGGDGKRYIDYDMVIKAYNDLPNQKALSQKLGISTDTIHNILINHNIPIKKSHGSNKEVEMLLDNKTVQKFYSCGEAARFLISIGKTSAKVGTVTNKITECANGKRKSAYGYDWQFII